MDYEVFKELRVKEDELHLSTKSQFCINLINELNGEICDNDPYNQYLETNDMIQTESKKKENHKNNLFANDKKNLDMKARLKYLLSREDNEYTIIDEELYTLESSEGVKLNF